MFIVRNVYDPTRMDSEAPFGQLIYTVMAVMSFVPVLAGCAGSGMTADRNGSGRVEPQSDVQTERLERVLDEQQKKRLKPSDASPGPIMVSLFARQQKGAPGQGQVNKGTSRQPIRRRKEAKSTSERESGHYRYLILLSKEWAYNNRPIQEPFLEYARPAIKIMDDWKMNRFLSFLQENKFKQFPSTNRISPSDLQELSGTAPVLTVWHGDRFRRVHFTDWTREQIDDTVENTNESPRINRYSNRLIIGFIRAYNAAGRNRMQVQIGPSNQQNRLEEMIDQAGSEENRELKEQLYKARVFHKNGKYRKAKDILTRILEPSRGTTYSVDVRNLLHAVNEALQNE